MHFQTLMTLTEAFAKVLRTRRVGAELTQAEVALMSGLHPNFVSRLELGKSQPTIESLGAIARALSTTAVSLVEETEALATADRRPPRPRAR